ncbi:Mediator of RNA polymerase II transcription subunit 15a-like protein, partial [Drosera capensis]
IRVIKYVSTISIDWCFLPSPFHSTSLPTLLSSRHLSLLLNPLYLTVDPIPRRLFTLNRSMDSNSWGAPKQEPGMAVDSGDWRSQLQSDSRQRIVNKIMETLKKHIPLSGQEGLQELRKIAMRFEEKIYTAATSQSDYLRKISLKMLTMESKSQSTLPNAMASNSTSKSPQDPG